MSTEQLISELMPLTTEIVTSKEQQLKRMFTIGCKVVPFVGEHQKGLIAEVAKAVGIPRKQLYEYAWMARQLECDSKKLDDWCEEKKSENKKPSIHGLRLHLKPEKHDEAYGGAEERQEHLLEQAEFAAERVQEAATIGDVSGTEQAVGEAIAELLVGDGLGHGHWPGQKAWKNKHMLQHVAETVCPATGSLEGEVHHLIPKSRGAQGSDLFTVKLAKQMHDEWHKLGAHGFAEKHGIDLRLEVHLNVTSFIDRLCDRIAKHEGPNWTL